MKVLFFAERFLVFVLEEGIKRQVPGFIATPPLWSLTAISRKNLP